MDDALRDRAQAEAVPDGFWVLEVSQNPQPISPMAESFFLDTLTAGARHILADLGLLLDGVEWRSIGGWVYTRSIPFTGDLAERLSRCAESIEGDLAGTYVRRWHAEWRPWLGQRSADLADVDLEALDDAALAAHVAETVAFTFAAMDVHMLLHGSNALMLGELAFACRDLLGWDEAQTLDLVCGLSPESSEPARRLAELADLARHRTAVRALLEDPARAVGRRAEAAREVAAACEAYVAEFGPRAVRYEVIDPTVGELPDLVLRQLRNRIMLDALPAVAAAGVSTRQAASRAAARAALAERHPHERSRFDTLLARAEAFYPLREDNEVWTVAVPLGLARHALLEVGRRLAATGCVADAADVFYLRLDEARAALRKGGELARVVMERQDARKQASATVPPMTYGTPPPEPDFSALPGPARLVHETVGWLLDRILAPTATARRQDLPTIGGIGAARGQYTGPARIVRDERDLGKLRPGDVLVCPVTAPAWAVIAFPSVSALVTDTGGILSHPAIIARELGIPAVIGTGNASALLRDGQIVTVDGDAGRVETAG